MNPIDAAAERRIVPEEVLLRDIFEEPTIAIRDLAAVQRILGEAFATLPPRTLMILRMRYGFPPHGMHTFDAIGEELGFSNSYASQIAQGGLRKLRQALYWKRFGDAIERRSDP